MGQGVRRCLRPWTGVVLLLLGVFLLSTVGLISAVQAGTSYEYDELGRIIRVNYDDQVFVKYTYDPAGNRTLYSVVDTATYDPLNGAPPVDPGGAMIFVGADVPIVVMIPD